MRSHEFCSVFVPTVQRALHLAEGLAHGRAVLDEPHHGLDGVGLDKSDFIEAVKDRGAHRSSPTAAAAFWSSSRAGFASWRSLRLNAAETDLRSFGCKRS